MGRLLVLLLLLQLKLRVCAATYDHSHNEHCVQWRDHARGRPFEAETSDPALRVWAHRPGELESLNNREEETTRKLLVSADGSAALPRHDTAVCRIGHDLFGIVLLSPVVGACEVMGDENSGEQQRSPGGVVNIAYLSSDCRIWWHPQAFNALPLPLMAYFVSDAKMTTDTITGPDSALEHRRGICLPQTAHGDIGTVHAGGSRFGSCILPVGDEFEGGYLLLGAYNMSARYQSKSRGHGEDTLRLVKLHHQQAIRTVVRLVDTYIGPGDRSLIERVAGRSGHSFSDLMDEIQAGGDLASRFLSADRFVHHNVANERGLHLLRSVLASKITDARRRKLGMHKHPDYATFMRDGYLVKDYASMTGGDDEVVALLRMVSGYNRKDIPDLVWRLRTVVGNDDDNNLNLHVDSVLPSWKVWLYAQEIRHEHGPLHYVVGSHAPSESKLRFLYRASNDPPDIGAGSYGSFRVGMYGQNRTADERRASIASRRPSTWANNNSGQLAPYQADENGVWRCHGCVSDERDYGMRARTAVTGEALSLVIADVSGLHGRGLSKAGTLRRTFVIEGHHNDGGLRRVNPFKYELVEN